MVTIAETRHGSVVVFAVSGRIDTTTAGRLEGRLASATAEGARDLLVDLSGVDYISSAGLRVLATVAERVRQESGSMVLCGIAGPVRRVFDLAGVLPHFTIVESPGALMRDDDAQRS